MKNTQSLILAALCGAALLFAATASAQSVQQGVATVVRVHGTASYSTGGGMWMPLKAGVVLHEGAVIKTDPDSTADIALGETAITSFQQTVPINAFPTFGKSPGVMNAVAQQNVIRMSGDSVLAIDKLTFSNMGVEPVSDTELDLRSGKIFGSVKKLSAMSRYEVKTPTGVAGIRGTSYTIESDGTVTCYEGSVEVSYVINGQTVVVTVGAGYKYTPATQQLIYLPPAGTTVEQWAAANTPTVVYKEGITTPVAFTTTTTITYISPTGGDSSDSSESD
jgi:FecR protein